MKHTCSQTGLTNTIMGSISRSGKLAVKVVICLCQIWHKQIRKHLRICHCRRFDGFKSESTFRFAQPSQHRHDIIGKMLHPHRRHLTQSEKAAAAVGLLPLLEHEARARLKTSTDGNTPQLSAKLHQAEGKACQQAANIMKVGARYVSDLAFCFVHRHFIAQSPVMHPI